jgi:dual specificity MAP kinase phosphatase
MPPPSLNLVVELRRLAEQLRRQGLVLTFWAGVDKVARWITGGPLRRFSRLGDGLWLGGQPRRRGLERLMEAGVTGFVNMRSEHNYEQLVEATGGPRYLHLPTDDNTAPTLDHLSQGVDFIREEVEGRQGGVYIHCWEGLGRGPTMAAAYYVSQGYTPEAAWKAIRAVRPFVRPTETQMERLRVFAGAYTPGEAIERVPEARKPGTVRPREMER